MKKSTYNPKYRVKPEDVRNLTGQYTIGDGYHLVIDNESSKPFKIIDAVNGREYIDYFTCFASMPLGFNHPKMMTEDFIEYIGQNGINKPSNSDLYSEAKSTFVNTLFKVTVPKNDFKYSFFIEGGALAVENALKAAIDCKVKKNFKKGIKEEKGHKILHFKEAFHGRSGYTLSLTNTDPVKVQYFPKFDWPRVSNPKITFPLENNLDIIIERENKSINEIENAFKQHPDEIAAIIIEPIQGEGGDNHFRIEFLQKLREIADEYEAMLIYDEIQTGVGMTGTMWAYQQLGAKPDILCFGKKMQVCGILSNDRIDEIEDNVFRKSSRINSTWGGGYTDMVRATKYLEIIEEDNLVGNAATMGDYLLENIKKLENEFPDKISNSRGRGLFAAFDIELEYRQKFRDKCFEKGLIILACGQNSIRFRTPLNINKEMVDQGFEIINKSLREVF